jgi:hypothetical protein
VPHVFGLRTFGSYRDGQEHRLLQHLNWSQLVTQLLAQLHGLCPSLACNQEPRFWLARLGIRGFKPHLRKAPERLAGLRTAEGTGLPANIIEEFRRDMAQLALVREQISSIVKTRAERLERAPDTGPHVMVRLLARLIGIGIETADMLVREILSRKLRDRRAGHRPKPAHHRSMNRQAFVSRAVGGGVATNLDSVSNMLTA